MPIYPQEQYPPEAVVRGLDGAMDAGTGLAYLARGVNSQSSPSYEVQYNRREHRQNRILAAMRQGMVVDEGNRRIGVYPIRYTLGGARHDFNGATGVVVADGTTSRVYLDAANSLQVQASFPTNLATFLPLATVVAAGGVLTIIDERVVVLFAV